MSIGSGASFEAEDFSSCLPTQRQVAAAGRKRLGSKLGWLVAVSNVDDRRGEEGQPNDSTDVAFANSNGRLDRPCEEASQNGE